MSSESLLCFAVGVNNGLAHAETDASAMAGFFARSSLAPPGATAELVRGAAATRGEVLGRLTNLMWKERRVGTLIFFFSGHGSARGIELSDGTLCWSCLHQHLDAVRARRVLIILDSCRAGAAADVIVGGVDESRRIRRDYALLLAQSLPGFRVLAASTRAEDARELEKIGGAFTRSLLAAFEYAHGQLRSGTTRFVSDGEAVQFAATLMGSLQVPLPVFAGPRADFPIARAQTVTAVGSAEITRVEWTSATAGYAVVHLLDRCLVNSRISLLVTDRRGQPLAQMAPVIVRATRKNETVRLLLRARPLGASAALTVELKQLLKVPLEWHVAVEDERGRELDRSSVVIAQRRAA